MHKRTVLGKEWNSNRKTRLANVSSNFLKYFLKSIILRLSFASMSIYPIVQWDHSRQCNSPSTNVRMRNNTPSRLQKTMQTIQTTREMAMMMLMLMPLRKIILNQSHWEWKEFGTKWLQMETFRPGSKSLLHQGMRGKEAGRAEIGRSGVNSMKQTGKKKDSEKRTLIANQNHRVFPLKQEQRETNNQTFTTTKKRLRETQQEHVFVNV